ncbi:MAG: damage-inducible protein CinA, partial [Alphaproteobacteria bacterium]
SVTGIAGPGGGSPEKPVGLVHLACASAGGETSHCRQIFEKASRHKIRMRSVALALDLVAAQLSVTMRLA